MFGLNKAALKISAIIGISFSFLGNLIDKIPKVIFGITIFLWILYIFTITLDWLSGISAARYEAKQSKKDFVFDKDKANTNWYKHALFLIIMSSIYNLQKESLRLGLNELVSNSLIGIQLAYFTYNMITEWVSIEKNRYRVNGKYSRLGNLLKSILDVADKAAIKKIEKITGAKED